MASPPSHTTPSRSSTQRTRGFCPVADRKGIHYARGVPRFTPFAGLRFSPEVVGPVDDVSCPPYDVITPAEHRSLLARSPYNVVRLEMPDDPAQGDGCYARARTVLDAWRAVGALRRDPTPVFYGYRTSAPAGDRPEQHTVGVIGALGLGDGVLPHEETTPRARTDRRRLLEELRVNVSPIWGLTPTSGLAGLVGAPESIPGRPAVGVAHVTDGDGVLHELWPVPDRDAQAAITALVGSQPVLLADGHHRYETALAYRAEREATGGTDRRTDRGAEALMAYVVELSEEQIHVQAIHRLVTGLPDGTDPLDLLRRGFTLEPTGPPDATLTARMRGAGAMAVVTSAGTWLAFASMATVASAVHDLDASRLDVVLAGLTGRPGVEVAYQHGWEQVTAAVGDGRAQIGLLLRPPTVRQIADISRGGVRMPAKTTFFWPKPRTGLVLRELDA
jgi:uncharacterized protein (DUF1015 family)